MTSAHPSATAVTAGVGSSCHAASTTPPRDGSPNRGGLLSQSHSLAVPPSGASDKPCNADLLPSKAGRPTHSRSGVNLRKTRAEKLATCTTALELATMAGRWEPLTDSENQAHSDRARELGGVGR